MINIKKLSKNNIYDAIVTGAKDVIKIKDYLNEINVFPVKDGDTGTNMTNIMTSIIENAKIEETLKDTLKSISNAALIGSKGNSGLIFSQFIYGFTKDINLDYIDNFNLINQLEKGYYYAYQSIENPVEGTMITLMRSLYEIMNNEKDKHNSFEEYLIKVNEILKSQLKLTKNQLKILKKYDVVDAGALAFTIFIDGFISSVLNNEANNDFNIEEKTLKVDKVIDHINNDIKYRYCTEVLLSTNIDIVTLKENLKQYGDSLVIGKSEEFIKVHIHTNNPDKIVEVLQKNNIIKTTKVDDMINQSILNNHEKSEICILTDSIADIDQKTIDHLNIQIFPINLNIADLIYYDKLTINNKQLIKLINENQQFPKTSSPSTISVIELLDNLKNHYKKIIIITVSSKMSSTYNVFNNAAKQFNNNEVTVIDSKLNSIAQGLLAINAANMVRENNSFEEVINTTNKLRDEIEILVRVKTLDNMVKGGRISKGLGVFARLIRLNPIISIDKDGNGIIKSKVIGKKNSFKKIIKTFKRAYKKYGVKTYAITHVNNLKEAEKLKTAIIKITNLKPEYITEASSVIALNAGNGAIAISYIKGVKS